MTKGQLLKEISKCGDAVLTVRNDGTFSDHAVTLDFSTKYIKKRKSRFYKMFSSIAGTDNLLVFSWTDNKFITISPSDVVFVESLSSVLK